MNATNEELLDTILHEMLHVVGVGTLWQERGLTVGYDTPSVAYIGLGGVAGCLTTGASCQTGVPVENTGGPGQRNGHWRDAVFGVELMTAYSSPAINPFSVMTARSLADLGFTVNLAAADPFTITGSGLRENQVPGRRSQVGVAWETPLGFGPYFFPAK